MTRLSLVDAKDLERLLLSIGFEKTRQKGNHAFYCHPDGRTRPRSLITTAGSFLVPY
jgi:predicted RNA binding protein YcfA (HicA-like mRNA interferase family)